MNLSNNVSLSSPDRRTEVENVFLALFVGIVMLFSVFGNTAVIVAIFMNRLLREELSNRLTVNLGHHRPLQWPAGHVQQPLLRHCRLLDVWPHLL